MGSLAEVRRRSIIFKIELFSVHNLGAVNRRICLYLFWLGFFKVAELARALPTVYHVVHTLDRQRVIYL